MKLKLFVTLMAALLSFSVFSKVIIDGELIVDEFNYGASSEELLSNSENPSLIRKVFFDIIEYDELVGLQLDYYHSELLKLTGPVQNEKLYMIYRENTKVVIGFLHTMDFKNPIVYPDITYYGASIVLDPLGTVAIAEMRTTP